MSALSILLRSTVVAGAIGVVIASQIFFADRPHVPYPRLRWVRDPQAISPSLVEAAFDPDHPDLGSLIGGPGNRELPPDFCVLWTNQDGMRFGFTFLGGRSTAGILGEAAPDGQLRVIHDLHSSTAGNDVAGRRFQLAGADREFRSLLDALAMDSPAPATASQSIFISGISK